MTQTTPTTQLTGDAPPGGGAPASTTSPAVRWTVRGAMAALVATCLLYAVSLVPGVRPHEGFVPGWDDWLQGTVFALGDNVQGAGTPEDFANCFEPSWGRHKARTLPAVGNHEYNVEGAVPHFEYWGERAGPAGKGYYSYDLGAWHIVVLNSNVLFEEQNEWLAADLRANPSRCTLAYWHHPWFTSSAYRGEPELKRFVQILEEAGADVVLTGHAHGYERFAPQTAEGVPDEERGIRHFVVGSGGAPFHPFRRVKANSEVRVHAYGVLKLELFDDRYTWEFVPIAGETFTDTGEGECH